MILWRYQQANDMKDKGGGAASENNVIHIKEKNKKIGGRTKDKHGGISPTTGEAEGGQEGVELVEPGSRSLLKTI